MEGRKNLILNSILVGCDAGVDCAGYRLSGDTCGVQNHKSITLSPIEPPLCLYGYGQYIKHIVNVTITETAG